MTRAHARGFRLRLQHREDWIVVDEHEGSRVSYHMNSVPSYATLFDTEASARETAKGIPADLLVVEVRS